MMHVSRPVANGTENVPAQGRDETFLVLPA
jgi:hypothetical protein